MFKNIWNRDFANQLIADFVYSLTVDINGGSKVMGVCVAGGGGGGVGLIRGLQ